MICPPCGVEVPASKFCENCGTLLPAVQVQESAGAVQAGQMASEPSAAQVGQAPVQLAQPVIEPIDATSFAASQPEPNQAAFEQLPESQNSAQVASAADNAPEPPVGSEAASYQPQESSGVKAPNAAFVLAIVGLVLSALFVTFLPGLVCSIVGLALNASYNKKGMDNPRTTPTLVIGIIGLVTAALCIAATVYIGVVAVDVMGEAERQGVDITADSVKVTTDKDGKIAITADDGESSASSQAVSPSAPEETSSASSSSLSSSAAADVSSGAYSDAKYHDAAGNPSLYSVMELSGSEFQALLESYGFAWDADLASWSAPSGTVYGAIGSQGALSREQLAALPASAADQPVVLVLAVTDYDTPESALSALSGDVVVEETHAADSVTFAIVYGSPMEKCLVAATTADDSQILLIFTDASISSGLFEDLVGIDAGSSIDEVWNVIRKS